MGGDCFTPRPGLAALDGRAGKGGMTESERSIRDVLRPSIAGEGDRDVDVASLGVVDDKEARDSDVGDPRLITSRVSWS